MRFLTTNGFYTVIRDLFRTHIQPKFVSKDTKVLGRWNIDYCDRKTNHKIDWSNEDHCGPCGQYMLNRTNTLTQPPPKYVDMSASIANTTPSYRKPYAKKATNK